MWYDGTTWTQFTRPRPGQAPPAGEPGLPGLLGSISDQMQQGARDPRGIYRQHQQGLDTATVGAPLIDGLVGLPTRNGNRRGVTGSVVGIVVGLVFVGVGVFLSSAMKTPANSTGGFLLTRMWRRRRATA